MINLFKRMINMDETKKKGRPVKEDPNKDYDPAVINALEDTAIGLSKLDNGKYAIVKIKYNAISGEVGVPQLKLIHGDSSDAEYNFRDDVDNLIYEEFSGKK